MNAFFVLSYKNKTNFMSDLFVMNLMEIILFFHKENLSNLNNMK